MVADRDTVQGMLRDFESLLPLKNAFVGSILKAITDTVVPVIDLSSFDQDVAKWDELIAAVNAIPAAGPYGSIQSIDHGTGSGTRAGSAGFVTATMAAVPASKVHIYRNWTFEIDDTTTREVSAFVTNPALGNWQSQLVKCRTDGQEIVNIISSYADTTIAAHHTQDRPWIIYPGQILAVAIANVANAKTVRYSWEREEYNFAKVLVDDSADMVITTP